MSMGLRFSMIDLGMGWSYVCTVRKGTRNAEARGERGS